VLQKRLDSCLRRNDILRYSVLLQVLKQKGIETLKKGLVITAIFFLLGSGVTAADDTDEKLIGDESDGSRAVPVHVMDLFDEEGNKITPEEDPPMPFSTKQTCGECHSYDKIAEGWHFNAVDPNVKAGRAGQPWIYVDAATGTQIPLSYRDWPGTYKPGQIGLTGWHFTELFARQLPGGGPGEIEPDNPDLVMRQFVSGKLEINCLACHNAEPAYNQAQYATAISRQNYRWAPTAACRFATVTGSAKNMPDTFDPLMPDESNPDSPTVKYDESAFGHKNQLFFDIVKKVPDHRCYFCHSNKIVGQEDVGEHILEEDVHISADLSCVDCHRNELDHKMVRGYECEHTATKNPLAAGFSCEGCHVPDKFAVIPAAGRLGAPVAKHRGMPNVHFEKLTCTACHSGAWPEETYNVKTSRAHALGTYNSLKDPNALPHIITPVFAKQSNGKIGVNNLIWPAYWAGLRDDGVTPLDIEKVKSTVDFGGWNQLTKDKLLKTLKDLKAIDENPAYICGGKLYKLDKNGKLTVVEHEAAKPYIWPIGHDVRPAAQSLGSGVLGCRQCHGKYTAFLTGKVPVDSPLISDANSTVAMASLMNIDTGYMKLLGGLMVLWNPVTLIIVVISSVVLTVVLLLYCLKLLGWALKLFAGKL